MPFDFSGGFYRENGPTQWQDDRDANIKIRADSHDAMDNDFADGLSNVICRDGQSQIANDIPWNGKKITNLGAPSSPNDAARLADVTTLKTFSTGIEITGANELGRLTFWNVTGTNGIAWNSIDGSLMARVVDDVKHLPDRWVFNSDADPSVGTDVISIDKGGRITSVPAEVLHNAMWDGTSYRVLATGIGTILRWANAGLHMLANDTATVADNLVGTFRDLFSVQHSDGNMTMLLSKKESGKAVTLQSLMGDKLRWDIVLGNGTAEDATNLGSDFVINAYKNDGTLGFTPISIARKTGYVNIPDLAGPTTVRAGYFTVSSGYFVSPTSLVLGSYGGVYIYPLFPGGTAGSVFNTAGDLTVGRFLAAEGHKEHTEYTTGSYGTSYWNMNYNSGMHLYIGNSHLGVITVTCDYRLKKDVHPLSSTWEKVKALRPITYTPADYADADGLQLSTASDEERWGFLAHELQEMLPTAANGIKDAPGEVQSVNLIAVVAALTAALQEAQARIEALEARA